MKHCILCIAVILALMVSFPEMPLAEMSKVVHKIPSPDKHHVAFQRNTWGHDGPDYPDRCEIWISDSRGGSPHRLHEFVLPSKELRQKVCIEAWTGDGSMVIVSSRQEPRSHMTDNYEKLLQSTLWHMPVKGTAWQWKRGVFPGGIIGVRGNLVCAGTDLSYGGGAGMPDWREFKTLLVTDLEGTEKLRFTRAAANADRSGMPSTGPGECCFSPDGNLIAVLSSSQPPEMQALVLQVWRLRDGVKHTVEKVISFRWTRDKSLIDLETLEGKRRYDGDRGVFISSSR